MKTKFKEVKYGIVHWKYAKRKTVQIYKLMHSDLL